MIRTKQSFESGVGKTWAVFKETEAFQDEKTTTSDDAGPGSARSRRARIQQAGDRWAEEARTALAGAFAELRNERGWSKSETADEMGVSARQYGLYEAGETLPSLPTIWRFEQALGLPSGRVLVIAGLIADIETWELSALDEVSRSRAADQRPREYPKRPPEDPSGS